MGRYGGPKAHDGTWSGVRQLGGPNGAKTGHAMADTALGQEVPRGGSPLAGALECGSAGRVARDVGACRKLAGVQGGGLGLAIGTASAYGVGPE